MPGVSHREVHAIHLASVRHDVKSEIQGSSPDVFNFRVPQLRVNADHALAQDLGAFADGLLVFWKECSASTEEHSPIGRQAVIVEIVLGVVDHAVAGAQFARHRFRQDFGRDDVGADRNNLFLQLWSGGSGVTARACKYILGPKRAARSA